MIRPISNTTPSAAPYHPSAATITHFKNVRSISTKLYLEGGILGKNVTQLCTELQNALRPIYSHPSGVPMEITQAAIGFTEALNSHPDHPLMSGYLISFLEDTKAYLPPDPIQPLLNLSIACQQYLGSDDQTNCTINLNNNPQNLHQFIDSQIDQLKRSPSASSALLKTLSTLETDLKPPVPMERAVEKIIPAIADAYKELTNQQ